MDGYKGKSPDFGWWEDQIRDGERHREKVAQEKSWPIWRSYYRGQWRGDVMPMNLFFTMMRTVVPRIYFRNPGIAIRPGKPGAEHAIFAKILERVDNKLMRQMKIKPTMRKMIQDTFSFGTSFGKLGFGSMYNTKPDFGSGLAEDKNQNLLEYNSNVRPGFPAFWRVSASDVVLPSGLREFDESRWLVHSLERPLDDVKNDPRLKYRANVGASERNEHQLNLFNDEHRVATAKLWEIRDKKTGEVFILAPDTSNGKHELHREEDFFLGMTSNFPIFPLVFNSDDEFFWGTPDSQILEPYQLEINEIKTQIMHHRRFATSKILARIGSISVEEAQKMVDESILPVIFTNGNPDRDLKIIQGTGIPPELRVVAMDVLQDVRESIGFGRNQFGEFKPGSGDTTATEANIVRMASEIRIDERRDIVADMLTEVFAGIHEIIFSFWHEEVVELVGPGGLPVWVNFTGNDLARSSFNVGIDPDTSVPETRAIREQRAASIFQMLAPNPLIDPVALTKHLLNSFNGVQFDDLMKELPPPPPGTANGAINPQQFSQMIEQRVAAR